MSHPTNWFALPPSDKAELGLQLERESSPIPTRAGSSFPGAQESVRGALSADVHACLARVAGSGGTVVLPRTDLGDPALIAMMRDTEGNVVGLHAPR